MGVIDNGTCMVVTCPKAKPLRPRDFLFSFYKLTSLMLLLLVTTAQYDNNVQFIFSTIPSKSIALCM